MERRSLVVMWNSQPRQCFAARRPSTGAWQLIFMNDSPAFAAQVMADFQAAWPADTFEFLF